ncbi:MAG: DegT/DnrJ/EryC1/StrS family aminotransferase [Clostridia bacterium]|nr:DegT/DnrJ/EryC1/StrS family aminotransferase [Clostridia bacterium]
MIYISKPLIGQEEIDAVINVIKSGALASGSVVTEFENEFSNYLKASYAVATSSGTTALEIALKASGIGKGDKVLTTPFSFIASTNAILYAGANPVFADIDEKTYNISADSIEKALISESDIKALLIVHLYGQSCDMDKILEITKKYNLVLIEDCAQAHGAEWKGKKAGTFGDAAAFSFYPTKNMTTSEGGMVVTNKSEIASTAKLLINHGMETRYYHQRIGYNYRMTNISAAIGLCQLKKLDLFNTTRRKNAAFFDTNITNPKLVLPYTSLDGKHVYHQYTLKVKDGLRNKLADYLHKHEVGYGIYYPLSIPQQHCYRNFDFNKNYPVTDRIKEEVLSIPVHPALTVDEKETIVKVLNGFQE